MPTSHTARLYDGEPDSFTDFALSCARSFMWFVHQRDENLSTPPAMASVSSYVVNEVASTAENLRRWQKMSDDEKYEQWREYSDKVEDYNKKAAAEWESRNARYVRRLEEVEAWDCPEELINLKNYMREQLKGDMRDAPYSQSAESFDQWVDAHDEYLVGCRDRAEKRYDENVENVKRQNKVTALLYSSLGLKYKE